MRSSPLRTWSRLDVVATFASIKALLLIKALLGDRREPKRDAL
jgi:hypothetical protein